MIMEYIIDPFLLARCQNKPFEQGYDILKRFVPKRWASLMKYFGFMLLTRSVEAVLQ